MSAHTVQFYEDENFLNTGLFNFISSALSDGNRAIAIATGDHLKLLEERLSAHGLLDAEGNATIGRYSRLNADQIRPLVMKNGQPNEERFRNIIGDLIVGAMQDHFVDLFVFGEMAALMRVRSDCLLNATDFKNDATVHIERYFNTLLTQFDFTLLCAYPLSAFPSGHDTDTFNTVCDLHNEVIPAESYDPTLQNATLQRIIAGLQQRAHALRHEVHDRQRIELALREVNVDRLTGLPNRNVFQDRLELDLKKANRSGLPLALLFIDLDHFKEINDTRGHEVGDLLLKAVGQRLQSHVRQSDTVARLGGDEFTITLAELHEIALVTDIAQDLCNDLARPFMVAEAVVYISASIGITLYPRDAANVVELLRNADQAMYRSKERGRNCFTYFKPSMQDAAQNRMAISNELRRAVDNNNLEVYYQPIVDLNNGKIHKAEALLRWHHPERGYISPDEFIPVAEHTGLISKIGNRVYQQALVKAREWRVHDPNFTININVSPLQFHEGDSEHCRHWLGLSKPDEAPTVPEMGIEITEGLLLLSDIEVLKQLAAFQQAGIEITLDDFGTGYSSLSYLRSFSLNFLKIDKSFVYNLEYDADNLALCEAIIVMAHKLSLRVIAEGVETRQQADILKSAGCDFGQGFLYGPAMPALQFETLLISQLNFV